MLSFNGVELEVGQRVITVEDAEYFTSFADGVVVRIELDVIRVQLPIYNNCMVTRAAADLIVIKEDK